MEIERERARAREEEALTSTKKTCSPDASSRSGVSRSAELWARLVSSQTTPTLRRFDGGCDRAAIVGVGWSDSVPLPSAPPPARRRPRWPPSILVGGGDRWEMAGDCQGAHAASAPGLYGTEPPWLRPRPSATHACLTDLFGSTVRLLSATFRVPIAITGNCIRETKQQQASTTPVYLDYTYCINILEDCVLGLYILY